MIDGELPIRIVKTIRRFIDKNRMQGDMTKPAMVQGNVDFMPPIDQIDIGVLEKLADDLQTGR